MYFFSAIFSVSILISMLRNRRARYLLVEMDRPEDGVKSNGIGMQGVEIESKMSNGNFSDVSKFLNFKWL